MAQEPSQDRCLEALIKSKVSKEVGKLYIVHYSALEGDAEGIEGPLEETKVDKELEAHATMLKLAKEMGTPEEDIKKLSIGVYKCINPDSKEYKRYYPPSQ
ncbi:hypothetical protein KY347_06965 [Candidatus Woesearchaeota archaeon]|nr:hypothetical protein [Candidatus Woesearchaeota archaeon]